MTVTYDAEFTPVPGSIVDGAMRRICKVTLYRYDTPTSKGVKCGTEVVRAWTSIGLNRECHQAKQRLMRRDQAKRRNEIRGRIERIRNATGLT